MADETAFFHTFETPVLPPSDPAAIPTGKAYIGVGSINGRLLITLIGEDGACLTAAVAPDTWNKLMIRAAEQIEALGCRIAPVPDRPMRTIQ